MICIGIITIILGLMLLSIQLYSLKFINILEILAGLPVLTESPLIYMKEPVIYISIIIDLIIIIIGIGIIFCGKSRKK